ncbi:MAG: pitrilysin family protein [Deltaproteobacteria bacterium]
MASESVSGVSSVAVGLWVENGSRHERQALNGISHFIEHLFFKGTDRRSARRIAEDIERLGGSINAFTGKENTCYHTRTLAEHLEPSLDVLADIYLNSLFGPEDVELEREVITQEILDAEDSPEDVVHDYFLASYWPGHPLGWPILGTVESLGAIGHNEMVDYVRGTYSADRTLIVAAGAVDHDRLVELASERFGHMTPGTGPAQFDRPDFRPGTFARPRDLEQVHLLIGFPGLPYTDVGHEASEVLVAALGGGMSSRLFQKVREERGLAYSVYAFSCPFKDIGYTGVYAATAAEHVAEVVDLVLTEVSDMCERGLESEELEGTKDQMIGGIPLALESTDTRMMRLARNQLYYGRELSVAEASTRLRSVTNDNIVNVARGLFSFERLGIALLGEADEDMVSLPLG